MSTIALFALAIAVNPAQAQSSKAEKKTEAYRTYRMEVTEPPYGLFKVQRLIKSIKHPKAADGEMADEIEKIPDSAYRRLNFNQKFTYTMIHGEQDSQNCDAMPQFVGEEHLIWSHPVDAFDDGNSAWSERQNQFLKDNRAKVIPLIRATIRTRHRAGANLRQAILQLDAWELIPDVMAAYRAGHEDQDDLSVLMLLMNDGKYKPFMDSNLYKQLFGEKDNYQSHIIATPEAQRLILKDAAAYHRSRRK